ncbi:MAG TPA: NUDIX domain-containing protein [Anaerolineaceae bacterium]|nr:NUDIX domain-containing protein [Anaerolineaceae bacterium]HPN53197.1 NUDIX domain-containing protein [Anaerolineaceae bacterium]
MMLDFVFQIWRRMSGFFQWWFLWLVNAKFMVSVSGVILDGAGRVLLQRHRHWVPDVWGLPGGILHAGESLEDGLAREVREETGLEIADIVLIKVVSGYRLRMEGYFKARLAGTEMKMKLQKDEVLEARFFAPDSLPEQMLPLQRKMVGLAYGKES